MYSRGQTELRYLRGQRELQSAVCREGPVHSRPPFSGGGLSQERRLCITPGPHWGSQSDQAPQLDQAPSTETERDGQTGAHSRTRRPNWTRRRPLKQRGAVKLGLTVGPGAPAGPGTVH